MQSLFYKIKKKCRKFIKYLHMSKKSSTFVPDLKREHNRDYVYFTKMIYLCKKFEKQYKSTNYF